MSSDRRVGQRFGDYLVEAVIGRGGMGVVFRASQVVSGHIVALKLMAPDLADNAVFRDRFVREAEAGPNLLHPNIVRVFESGEADGELFIAMELIDGTDLKGLIQQEGPLDPRRALSIFRQAASALDAAHESGMVHRDVKPQNILVIPRNDSDSADRAYLTDFGLVRPVASESSATRTGQVFGSIPYMAPEIIEGIPADGRADVYALACVVYESLTGSIPFERDNEVSAVWAHIHEDPPLVTEKRSDLPGGLNDVLFRAMSKHPDDRYLTCGEFVTELELGLGRKLSAVKYSHVRPLVARIPRRKTEREVWAPNFFPELSRVRAASRERFDWRKGVALVAAVAVLSSIQVGRKGGIPQAVADVAKAADSAVDSAVTSAIDAVIDPEPEPVEAGDRVADRGRDLTAAGRQDIHKSDRKKLKALLPADPITAAKENGSQVGVPEPASGAGKIAWARAIPAPGGYNTGDVDIWVMDPDGTNEVNLTRTELMEFWPSWSPDGAHIAFVIVRPPDVTAQDLWVMNADGSNRRDLGLCPGVGRCGKLAWSPDGRRVAYAQGNDLWVADLASGTRERLVSGQLKEPNPITGGRGSGPTWSPDGKSLAFECGDDLCVVAADGGEPRVIGPGLGDPDWSPEGTLLVGEDWPASEQRAPDIVIHRFDRNGQDRLIAASGHSGVLRFPSWAPDGGAIVYSDEQWLFRIDRDGTDRVKLTSGPWDLMPDWGPGSAD
ncbi:MAG: serine/threonine-protein kinase [Actinomycetota bacterium]|nr:serine/threonine-protein kinase [Actinomycetota bacterium]